MKSCEECLRAILGDNWGYCECGRRVCMSCKDMEVCSDEIEKEMATERRMRRMQKPTNGQSTHQE